MRSLARVFLFAALCATATICTADTINFAGSYTLTPHKQSGKPKKDTVQALTVVQTESSIEVTETIDERTNTYHYPLGGQDGIHISPTGFEGTCKGSLRKKDLTLESFVTTRPDPNGPSVQIHITQKWKLSADLKTLRIHFDVDSPQSPMSVVDPWTDIYTRN